MTKIMNIYSKYARKFAIVLAASVVGELADLSYTLLLSFTANHIAEGVHVLAKVALAYGTLMAVGIVVNYITNIYASVLTNNISTEYTMKLYHKYLHLPYHYHDDNRVGESLSVMGSDLQGFEILLYGIPTYITQILVSVVGAVIIFSKLNMKLFAFTTPILAVLMLMNFLTTAPVKEASKNLRDVERDVNSLVEDKLSGVRAITSFAKEDVEENSLHSILLTRNKKAKYKYAALFVRQIAMGIPTDLFYLAIMLLGGYLVIKGELKITDVLIYYTYAYKLVNPIQNLAGMMKDISTYSASYEKILTVLGTDEEIKDSNHPLQPEMNRDIVLNNVSFSYNGKDEVLNNISTTIKGGEYLAIVGPSGSGKSTIASLIPRYYDTTSGSITIGGVNIRDIKLSYLRQNIGVVQQDIYLFNGSIYDNIAYGCNEQMDDAELFSRIQKAAKMANADEFISKLPDGYNTDIGERGVKLSGGQKQRIAIARILMSSPSIMIFDEATSALDNQSEKEVQVALDNIAKETNCTIVSIAHRLSTIKNADRIIMLTEDGIVEEGSHSNLIKMGGKYAHLYAMNK
jgi:ATP-binding cassette subfamily B protein